MAAVVSSRSGLYAIVSDAGGGRILVTRTGSGMALPFVSLEPGGWSEVDGREIKGIARAARAVEHETGLHVEVLYRTEWPKGDEHVHRVLRVHAFESSDADARPAAPHEWADRAAVIEWTRPFMADAVAVFSALADARERPVPWWTPGWTGEALAWLDGRLASAGMRRSGRVSQVKNDWQSVVMRAPTDGGDVYLKALARPAARELTVLRDVLPPGSHVPRVLGLDRGRGLFLTRDVGGVNPSDSARGALTPEELRSLTEGYAQVQRRTVNVVPGSVFDCRLERIPELLSAVIHDLLSLLAGSDHAVPAADIARLRELAPAVVRVCRAADAAGIPPHLVHADLDGNTVVTPNGPVFFDWAAAYVSHPFFDVWEFEDSIGTVTDAGGTDAAIDHYLNAWTEYGAVQELRRIIDTLRAIRWAPGLIKGAHCLRHLPEAQSPVRRMPLSPLAWSADRWQRGMLSTLRRLCDDLDQVT